MCECANICVSGGGVCEGGGEYEGRVCGRSDCE